MRRDKKENVWIPSCVLKFCEELEKRGVKFENLTAANQFYEISHHIGRLEVQKSNFETYLEYLENKLKLEGENE